MIRWIFFDVGGTLFDEEPVLHLQEELIRHLLGEENIDVPDDEWQSAIRLARSYFLPRYANHLIWVFTEEVDLYEKIQARFQTELDKVSYESYREIVTPLDGITDLLRDLHQRFSLGLICNQPTAIRERLREVDLLDLFDVHAISSEMDLRKPDPRFFLAALSMAHCAPSETAMVGDRLDNDIAPARSLGMTAVRLKLGPHRHQPVLSPEFLPHYTCSGVKELGKLLLSEDFVPNHAGAEMVY